MVLLVVINMHLLLRKINLRGIELFMVSKDMLKLNILRKVLVIFIEKLVMLRPIILEY